MMIYGIIPEDVPGAFACPDTGLTVVPDDWYPPNTTREAWGALRSAMRVVGRASPMSWSEWQRQQKQAARSCVYFIAGEGTPVKIGLSNSPQARLNSLQTGHWAKLRILATIDGDLGTERAYHARFAAHRLHGEWFTRCPEIEAEIARLQAHPLPSVEGV